MGAAATLLGCAMLVVASGSLLPSVEDWFGARRELRVIQPLLDELSRRHPNVGIGVRPRGPLLFRVAEQMSLISDALYLEATAAIEGADGERGFDRLVGSGGAVGVTGGAGTADRGVDSCRSAALIATRQTPVFPVRIGYASHRRTPTASGSSRSPISIETLDRRVDVAAA